MPRAIVFFLSASAALLLLAPGGGAVKTTAALKRVHVKVPLPLATRQEFALYRIRVKTKPGAAAPKLRVRLVNLAHMPRGIRAAAARTKPTRSGRIWSFKFLVAINNLAPPTARVGHKPRLVTQVPASADVLIEVFSGQALSPGAEFVDDCVAQAYQKGYAAVAFFYALGTWPSSPQEIFRHTLQDAQARCP